MYMFFNVLNIFVSFVLIFNYFFFII